MQLEALLALESKAAERLPDVTKVAARLSTFGADPCAAMAKHVGRAARFRRWALAEGLFVLGGRHLSRGKEGRWHVHDHVLVLAADVAGHTLEGRVKQAWIRLVGREKNAVDAEAPRSVEAVIRYALGGAIEPPEGESIAALAGWLRGTKRKRLAIKVFPRAPTIQKTENSFSSDKTPLISRARIPRSSASTGAALSPATVPGTTPPGAPARPRGEAPGEGARGPGGPGLTRPATGARIRDRIVVQLRMGAMGWAAVVKRFASGERAEVRVELGAMVREGRLSEEQGRGGGRRLSLALVEDEQHAGPGS